MSIARIRTMTSEIPDTPRACSIKAGCPYRKDGVCDEPRTNHGNSDSGCHKKQPIYVLQHLNPLPPKGTQPDDRSGGESR